MCSSLVASLFDRVTSQLSLFLVESLIIFIWGVSIDTPLDYSLVDWLIYSVAPRMSFSLDHLTSLTLNTIKVYGVVLVSKHVGSSVIDKRVLEELAGSAWVQVGRSAVVKGARSEALHGTATNNPSNHFHLFAYKKKLKLISFSQIFGGTTLVETHPWISDGTGTEAAFLLLWRRCLLLTTQIPNTLCTFEGPSNFFYRHFSE